MTSRRKTFDHSSEDEFIIPPSPESEETNPIRKKLENMIEKERRKLEKKSVKTDGLLHQNTPSKNFKPAPSKVDSGKGSVAQQGKFAKHDAKSIKARGKGPKIKLPIKKAGESKRIKEKKLTNPFIQAGAVDNDKNKFLKEKLEKEKIKDEDVSKYEASFIDDLSKKFVTESQQAIYLKSMKDVFPPRRGRIEKPLSPKFSGKDMTEKGYHLDTFCRMDDEVEFTRVGNFTLAMNQAKLDLACGASTGIITRSGKKTKETSMPRFSKPRKLIISSSSDDE